MTRRLLFLCFLALGTLTAQPNPAELFSHQAAIVVQSSGLSRLELPNEVLTQVAADLSDLRIFDAQGREVPYSIEQGLPDLADREFDSVYPLEVVSVDRSTTEPERGQTRYREVYRLELDPSIPVNWRWQLRIQTSLQDFVRRVEVDSFQPAGSRVMLLRGVSFFRLQSGRIHREAFDLPTLPSHALEVTIEGDGGSFVTPKFELARGRVRQFVPREVPLSVSSQSQDGRWTEVELERPRGLTLTALRFGTSTPAFVRNVEVFDRVTGSPDRRLDLGEPVFRIPGEPLVVDLDVLVQPAKSDQLIVRIQNQDSPPLTDLSVTALVTSPTLLFSMSPGEGGAAAGTLRFGGGRAGLPRYDLAAIQTIAGMSSRELAPKAYLQEVTTNAAFSPGPLLGFASHPGAEVDARAYTHSRTVQLTPSPEGLTRIELSVQDAAVARPDFADVRLTDSNSAQWAYLLDRDGRQDWLPLTVDAPFTESGATNYRLTLPAPVAVIDRVRLDFPNAYFDRTYQLMAKVDGIVQYLAGDRLSGTGGDDAPIEIVFAPVRATELTLTVFDGNDQPLPAPAVEGRFPLPDLYTVAPAGSYNLLVGFPDDRPPVYELAQSSATVLAARAGTATLGEIAENPQFSAASRLRTGPGTQRALFWIALLAAVGVLGVMTLRAVRGEAGDAS